VNVANRDVRQTAFAHLLAMLALLDLRSRSRAAGVHLMISAAVAALAAALVFGLWYPDRYRLLSGGQGLFFLVVSVDVVLGPLLTFAVFDTRKGRLCLRRDLAVIAALQMSALAYGLYAVCVVRPVALVFEVDRFRAISAIDVYQPELPQARPEYRRLPMSGPWLLGARSAQVGAERNEALFMGLRGIDTGQRPIFWQSYAESRADALERSRPVGKLIEHYPDRNDQLRAILGDLKIAPDEARFLPLMARGDWVVLMNASGEVIGFAPYDGFF
jgi:hypothetical protein